MNNKMITIPYADAIEYGENTSALFKALWVLTDLIRLESNLKKHHRAYLHEGGHRRKGQGGASDYDQGICG